MKIKRAQIILLILINLITLKKAQAESDKNINPNYYFDFEINFYEIAEGQEMTVNIDHKIKDLKKENWKVKPTASEATTSIYNPETQKWIFSKNSWLKMPNIRTKFRITISSYQEKVKLKFLIKNLITNEIYETPEKTLWTFQAYKNYAQKINSSTKNWRQTKQTSESVKIAPPKNPSEKEQTKNILERKDNKVFLFLSGGAFLTAGIVGFTGKNDKIPL